MTARFSARLGLSFLLMAIAFLAFLLLSAPSASAHHRTGHETGNVKGVTTDTSTEESTEGSGTSGETEGTTAATSESIETPSGSVSGTTETSSNSSSSSGSSTASSNGKGTGSDKPYDPDPVHEATPPATAGPTSCPSYDDGNAGPYDHGNCNGTQGMHGNGGNGKCAGCTGKADDKWPGGQNVGDHNNGYECDHNGGIGKGNPAHSRCASPPPPCVDNPQTPQDECNPPPPCVDNPNTPQDECNPPGPCVDDMDTPQDECNPPQPCVDNPDTKKDECNPPPKPPKDDDDVLGRIVPNEEGPPDLVNNNRPVLPLTGATVGNYLWLALLLMGAGALMLWRVRDRGADA